MGTLDSLQSRAVFIGTGRYIDEDLPDLKVIPKTVRDLAQELSDPAFGRFAPEDCAIILDEENIRALGKKLITAALEANDVLLVYYSGHGIISGNRHDLYLALPGSVRSAPEFNSLEYDKLRTAVLNSHARTKIIVLDCCFSGFATSEPLSFPGAEMIDQMEVSGTYVLAAAHRYKVALVLPQEPHTAFTGRLLAVLRSGIPEAAQYLTIEDLYKAVWRQMNAEGLPQPQKRNSGTADQLPLIVNRAYTTAGKASGDISLDLLKVYNVQISNKKQQASSALSNEATTRVGAISVLRDAAIHSRIAVQLGVRERQVRAAVRLLDNGATVPFIARYRKEVTEQLSDVELRELVVLLQQNREIEERKQAVLDSVRTSGRLDETVVQQIMAADSVTRLEDINFAYVPKQRTKAELAREAGLTPLADILLADPTSVPSSIATDYVNPQRGIGDAEAALDGANAILVERIDEDADLVGIVREQMWSGGFLVSQVLPDKEAHLKYSNYFEFSESLTSLRSHQILAMFRAEKEGVISIDIEPGDIPPESFENALPKGYEDQVAERYGITDQHRPRDSWFLGVAETAWRQSIRERLQRDMRKRLWEQAEEEAVAVFASNLRNLLLAAPAGQRVTMGLDPGQRNGHKIAVVDGTGKILATTTIYPLREKRRTARSREMPLKGPAGSPDGSVHEGWEESITQLGWLAATYHVELVAIGNGTGSRDADRLIRELIALRPELELTKTVISEAGASYYSASAYATKELPDIDVSHRGAVSIARRLQDPLAELVKIEPRNIGIGQYQHDVSTDKLSRALDDVVEDCVNAVGVDLNTASVPLLSRVSGITPEMASDVVAYRELSGPYDNRDRLLTVPGISSEIFEQCAGFLRIRGGDNPLDMSSVHPESYPVVKRILETLRMTITDLIGNVAVLTSLNPADFADARFGIPTVHDILAELMKPGRDPRPVFIAPEFVVGVEDLEDIVRGMRLQGFVTNVTNFGAFVDVGVHRDGLVHISQISRTKIVDPSEMPRAGDVVTVKVLDVDRDERRISLSMILGDDDDPKGT